MSPLAPILCLADELLDPIVALLSLGRSDRSADLRHLALAHRRFVHLVRPYLLHSLVIWSRQQTDGLLTQLTTLSEDQRRVVKNLFVDGVGSEDRRTSGIGRRRLIELLEIVAPSLEHLSILDWGYENVPGDLMRALRRLHALQELQLFMCSWDGVSLSGPTPTEIRGWQVSDFLAGLPPGLRLRQLLLPSKQLSSYIDWPTELRLEALLCGRHEDESECLIRFDEGGPNEGGLPPIFSSLRALDVPSTIVTPELLGALSGTLEALAFDVLLQDEAFETSMPKLRLGVVRYDRPEGDGLKSARYSFSSKFFSKEQSPPPQLLSEITTLAMIGSPLAHPKWSANKHWTPWKVDNIFYTHGPEAWDVLPDYVRRQCILDGPIDAFDILHLLETGEARYFDFFVGETRRYQSHLRNSRASPAQWFALGDPAELAREDTDDIDDVEGA